VELFQNVEPASDGAVTDLERGAQRVDRKRAAHPIGQKLGQKLERAEVVDSFELADVLAKETIQILRRARVQTS
jgi:hypothetical protein